MAKTTIIQVPVSESIRDEAHLAALKMGFSSLQEAIRIFLTQLPSSQTRISFEPKPIQLSKKALKRYDTMSEEVASKKTKTKAFDDTSKTSEIMTYLNS